MTRFGAAHEMKAVKAGARCSHCREGFDETGGLLINSFDADGKQYETPIHEDCLVRLTVGGVNHQRGECGCGSCGGAKPPDPPSLTPREAARVAALFYKRSKGQRTWAGIE